MILLFGVVPFFTGGWYHSTPALKAPDRSRPDLSHHYEAEVNELLIQLNNAHNNGILVIAATNYINKIDPSILSPGRIDKKIFIGPPDFEARLEAFKKHLGNTPHQIEKWEYLGEETEFLTYAEIRYIVEEAIRRARDESQPVDLNYLMKVVLENPPSLSAKRIKEYQSWYITTYSFSNLVMSLFNLCIFLVCFPR